MAEAKTQSKIDAAADKAFAEAAAKNAPVETVSAKSVADAVKADTPKPEVKISAIQDAVAAPAEKAAPKASTKKAPVKKASVKKVAAKKAAPARKTAAIKAPAKKTPAAKKPAPNKAPALAAKKAADKAAKKITSSNPVTKLKDTIMATAEKTDFTAQAKVLAADVQTRAKTAYSKAGEFAGEAGQFNKANLEAVVESGKIFFGGAQTLVRQNIETGKTVIGTVTEDAKKVAAVKSPTELVQLQGELARRNFDAVVSFGSQRTEAWVKLYNEAFAPISNRVSVATEKFSKAA